MVAIKRSVTMALIGALMAGVTLLAHPGGLDANGGHTNKKTGDYHYHRSQPPESGQRNQSQSPTSRPKVSDSKPKGKGSPQATVSGMARVFGVLDGDTMAVRVGQGDQIKVRVHGIDAPESAQPFGSAAKRYASDLLFGQTVTIEEIDRDRYGRIVAKIHLADGRDFGKTMIDAGMAWHYVQYARKEKEYAASEAAARIARVGLWQDQNPTPPWAWRKAK